MKMLHLCAASECQDSYFFTIDLGVFIYGVSTRFFSIVIFAVCGNQAKVTIFILSLPPTWIRCSSMTRIVGVRSNSLVTTDKLNTLTSHCYSKYSMTHHKNGHQNSKLTVILYTL